MVSSVYSMAYGINGFERGAVDAGGYIDYMRRMRPWPIIKSHKLLYCN
jgi:hypothetical protein